MTVVFENEVFDSGSYTHRDSSTFGSILKGERLGTFFAGAECLTISCASE